MHTGGQMVVRVYGENFDTLERLLEARRNPLHEFTSWDSFKRDLAKVALYNVNSTNEVGSLLIEWISRGHYAPIYANNLFDALYLIESFLPETHHKYGDFWYESKEGETYHNCFITKALGGYPVWTHIDKIIIDEKTQRFYIFDRLVATLDF